MIPYFSQETISLGPITFFVWGMFLALATLTVFFLVEKHAPQSIKKPLIFDLFILILLSIIIGTRLGYILQYPSYYLSHPLEILAYSQGGLTSVGGLILPLISAFTYARLKKIPPKTYLPLFDLTALFLPLGFAIGRIGCFMIKDHPGKVTHLPWGILWPDGIIRHPVAVYLIIANLALFLFLHFIKHQIKPGWLIAYFLLGYSFLRFFLDFTRATDPTISYLTHTQWIFLVTFLSCLLLVKIKSSTRR